MKLFLAVLAAAVIKCCMSQAIEMRVMAEKNLFETGEAIILKCIVNEGDKLDVGWMIDWYKLVTESEKVHIGTNKKVEQIIEDSAPGHFEMAAANEEIDGKTQPVFTLIIKDVKHEDGGIYECGVFSDKTYFDDKELTVYKKPEKLVMEVDTGSGYEKLTDKKEFLLNRNTELGVKCNSTGGNPESKVVIKVGGKSVDSISKSQRKSVAGSMRFDESVTFDVTETAVIPVNSHLDNGVVSCENLDVEGNVLFSQEFSVKLEGASPMIRCLSTNITRAVGDTEVNITCVIEASPAVQEEDVVFYWYPRNLNKTVENRESVQPNQENGHYRAEMVETEAGVEIRLIIDRLYPQAFRDYYISVKNSKGPAEEVVTLERDYTSDRGKASSYSASLGMFVMIIIMHVFFILCQ